jgi:hypothetical protein
MKNQNIAVDFRLANNTTPTITVWFGSEKNRTHVSIKSDANYLEILRLAVGGTNISCPVYYTISKEDLALDHYAKEPYDRRILEVLRVLTGKTVLEALAHEITNRIISKYSPRTLDEDEDILDLASMAYAILVTNKSEFIRTYNQIKQYHLATKNQSWL